MTRSRFSVAALVAGSILTAVLLLFNVPENPVLEWRRHRVAGMVLGHAGLVLLAVGLTPAAWRLLRPAAAMDARRLALLLVAVVMSCAAAMVVAALAWPDYAHLLLTREWGLVEPMQFVLYLVAARLCFAIAHRSGGRRAMLRFYRLGGWVFRLFALEEIDYLGVPSSLARLAGVEGSRIGRAYVGALHDGLNVAAQYGFVWMPLLALGLGAVAASWWISGGRAAAVRDMMSWRLLPAVAGAALMGLAQAKDIHDEHFAAVTRSRLLDDLLEEPLELVAVLAVNATLVLELARRARALTGEFRPDYSATPA